MATNQVDTRTANLQSGVRPMLIGGRWVEAQNGAAFPVHDPATGRIIAHVAEGRKEDVDLAVAAARAAFEKPAWRYMQPAERQRLLWRLADLIEANADELAELEVLNQGKPYGLARHMDIPKSAALFRYYAGSVMHIAGKTSSASLPDLRTEERDGPAYHVYTLKEPIGVVGQIIPWNFPLLMAAVKLAPSLAAGCTSVLKPAEETPLTALRLGELILEAGFPEGVVNIVTGYGATAGAAIAEHPGIDKVAFTGSGEVGKIIARAATGNLKKVTLELGGKSPVIVLDDVDVEATAQSAADAIFLNAGQVCIAGSRIYAERRVFDNLVADFAAVAEKIQIGPGLSPSTQLGPLVSKRQQERVAEYVDIGMREGATVATGGGVAGSEGYFYKPTLLVNTNNRMRVVQEEIFGPVVVAQPVDDLSELVALANDSRYGLAASIWTKDFSRAHRLAAQMRAGTVWINSHSLFEFTVPFGGYKESGWGREFGMEAIDAYTETKSVIARL